MDQEQPIDIILSSSTVRTGTSSVEHKPVGYIRKWHPKWYMRLWYRLTCKKITMYARLSDENKD